MLATVNVTVLLVVAEGGLNTPVMTFGRPLTVSATLAAKPLVLAIVIVLLPLNPGPIVRFAGDADREKSG